MSILYIKIMDLLRLSCLVSRIMILPIIFMDIINHANFTKKYNLWTMLGRFYYNSTHDCYQNSICHPITSIEKDVFLDSYFPEFYYLTPFAPYTICLSAK